MKKIYLFAILFAVTLANAQVRNYNNGTKTAKTAKTANSSLTSTVKKESYSSSDSDSGSKFGIVAGVLISDEKGDDIESTASRTGFYAGVSYKTDFSESLGLEMNLVYATMGAQFFDEIDDELNYLQLPITLNAKVFKVATVQFGPQIGYLISATYDGVDYIDELNELDYGLVAGLGVQFPNTNFGLSGKFYYGLANINSNSDLGEVANTSYSIGAFYNF